MQKYAIFIMFVFASLLLQNVSAQWSETKLQRKRVQEFIRDNNGNLYVMVESDTGQINSTIFSSSDYGNTWSERINGLGDPYRIFPTLVTDGEYLYTSTLDCMFVSKDSGSSWLRYAKYDTNLIQWVDLISCKDSNMVIVQGTYRGNESMLSTDRGKTWKDLKTGGMLFDRIYGVLIQDTLIWFWGRGSEAQLLIEDFSGKMYKGYRLDSLVNYYLEGMAAINEYLFAVTDSYRVYRSSDVGQHWVKVFDGLPKDTVAAIKVIGNDIFIGGNGVAYVSRDYGKTWGSIGDGLPNTSWTNGFVILNDALFVSLYGGGVWFRSLEDIGLGTEDGDKTLPISFVLEQNFPNPFTDKSIIKYSMPMVKTVTLTVRDMLGRLVKTLVSETKSPGQYETSFSGEGLPNGMYLCTLEAGSVRVVRKMILYK